MPDNVLDIQDYLAEQRRSSQQWAVGNLDAVPDDAAEALRLEKISGYPASTIEPDIETVKKQQQALYTGELVKNSPYLQEYVQSHPMAARVSNDDYGNLDTVSQSAHKLGQKSVLGAAVEGFQHGFGAEGLAKEYADLLHMYDSPWWKTFVQTAGLVPMAAHMGMGIFTGAIHGVAGAIGADLQNEGMPEAWANRFTRDIVAGATANLSGAHLMKAPLHPQVAAEFKKIEQAALAAEPYVISGKEPPVGVDPTIDKYHVDQSKTDLKNLEEVMKDAQASITRERSPELFEKFMDQHFQGQKIGLNGERIAELYKDKDPHFEDNLLGWVPDIAKQLEVARETGGDVEVPLATWLARMKPELAKELHDDIRVRPQGLTLNESKVVTEMASIEKEVKPEVVGQIDPFASASESVREQAVLEPLLQRQASGWNKADFAKSAKLMEQSWRSLSDHDTRALVPKEGWFPYEQKAIDAASAVLDTILPQGRFESVPARSIEVQGTRATGAYVSYQDRIPVIAYLANPDTAVGTVRHEAIHFLRQNGFFTKEEWGTLKDAAFYNDWIQKHDIKERYQGSSAARMIEEAIAEEFKAWRHEPVEDTAIGRIFAKLQDLADKVRDAINKAIGSRASAEDIFSRIESGEIGSRKETKPLDPSTFAQMEESEKQLFSKANAIGMTVPQFKHYQQLIEKRNVEDMEAQFKRAQKFETERQTKEWKENLGRVTEEARVDVQARPDIAAGRFFIEGKLGDQEFQPKPRLRRDALTKEQEEALPRNFVSNAGHDPDAIASLFGYPTGDAMIERLIQTDQGRAGKKYSDYVNEQVKIEANARMEKQYGQLSKNILDEAYEHVLSKTQMDLLHEETMALGAQAGAQGIPLTKEQIKAWVSEKFEGLPASSAKTDKFLKEAGKAGKEAEMALLKGDAAEAFKQKQRQYLAVSLANEAKKFEKEMERFEKTAKRYSQRQVQGVEQVYADYAQSLLTAAGLPVRRSVKDLRESLQHHGYKSLEDFVGAKFYDGYDLAIADYIQQGDIKPLEQMKVQEFRDFKDAIDSLNHIGREEKKVQVGQQRMEIEQLRAEVLENVRTLPITDHKSLFRFLFRADAELAKVEEVVKDLDLRRTGGPLFNALIRPLAEAKAKEYTMLDKLSAELKDIKGFNKDWRKTLKDTIPNDFLNDPVTGTTFDMTRDNMINIMLNFGNRSNIEKFTKGYGGKEFKELEGRLWDLFDKHASKEDWQFVQKIWDLFETWRGEADSMYRRVSGVPPKWLEFEPIQTKHGEMKGGYFPIIYDKLRSNQNVVEEKARSNAGTFDNDYFRATTGAGYAKARTGYIDYVQFENSIEQVAGRMQQMIHDISHREAVINAGKIIYDKGIRAAIRKHYGMEYEKQLHPWLKDIANHFNVDELATAETNSWLRRFRFNLVSHALGLNLRVILSPNPGLFNPITAAGFWMNRAENVKIGMEHSQEIPHIMRGVDRDFREKLESTVKDKGWNEVQTTAFRWAMTPMLGLERELRLISFSHEFKKAVREGMNEGDAAARADSLMRERQGTAGSMDLPAVMRSNEAMKMVTIFGGFFNTMYNWQRQMPGQIRRGEYTEAMKTVYGAILLPTAINAALFTQANQEDSWFKVIAKSLVNVPLQTVPFVREAASLFSEGYSPKSPWGSVITAAYAAYRDGVRYAKNEEVKKPISHAANVIGLVGGLPMGQIGRSAQFGYDVAKGKQRPKNIIEWMRGIISGEAELKKGGR